MQYLNFINTSRKRKIISILFALSLFASFSLVVFAVPPIGGYAPGATLDPDCAPLDPDCTVTVETLLFDSPLTKTGNTVSLPAASAISDGYLSSTDYNDFSNKEDSFGPGLFTDYLRGDKTWVTLDTSAVPENGNLYWTNNRFDTRLAATTSIPNLQTVGTITSGVWHGSQITDAYVSDSITASNYIPLSQRGVANGVATLGNDGKVVASQLNSFSLSDTFVVNSEIEMLNLLSAELGDVAIRLDENKSYILTTNDPTNVANWQQIITPLDFVLSVNGQFGAVNLTTTDIAEGLNLYYTDSRVDDYLNTVKGVANGVASLDANGKVPTSQLGSIILNETHVVIDIPAMLALTAVTNGDLAVVTSTSQTYVLADDNDPSNINSWVEIVNGSPVTSVNGQVGTVNLTTTNISEGSNQYFTNARARSAFSATGPLIYNPGTGVFGITAADSTTNGYLTAVDWNTFNNKQSALTFGSVTASSNPEITITGGTGAVVGAGLNIVIPDASDTVRGLITTGAQNFAGIKNFSDGLGVGDASPSTLFSVGSGGLFQVDNTGDLVKIKNINYSWPSLQGAADTVLVNDGSGNLSWTSGVSIGGSNGQLQYNNAGSLAGVSGISYNGVNLDANDATFRIVNWGDTTKRAIFDAGYIDPGTTRTYTFPNAAGTLALTSDLTNYTFSTGLTNTSGTITNKLSTGVSGGQSIYGGTASGNNLTIYSTSHATKGKILFGTGAFSSAYDEANIRLGIGTSSPNAKLSILDSANVSTFVDFGANYASGLFTIGYNAGVNTITSSPYGALNIVTGGNQNINLVPNGSGKVGIGTTAPAVKLSVVSGNIALIQGGGASDSTIQLRQQNENIGYANAIEFSFGNGNNSYLGSRIVNETASGGGGILHFQTGSSSFGTYTTKMIILKNGNVGVGALSPSYRLSVSDTTTAGIVGSFTNSDGTCTLDPGDVSGWSCPSDLNLKKDITTLETGSLDSILALRPVTYRLINEDSSVNLSTGLIAQEVQTIFPNLVKTQIDGTLALNYGGLTPYMISAIQEMNLQITEIGVMEKPNSWRDALIAWFANTANGITEIFSKKVSTEELCVTDSVGQTCITRTQLDALLNGQGVPSQSPTPDPTPSPDPVPTPDPGTDSNDITPDDSVPVSDPEPAPEPDPVPTPTPDPVSDPAPSSDSGV